MPRVLIASDDREDVPHWAEGYRDAGWEVIAGTTNFELCASHFDVIHYLWPEELTGWQLPSPSKLAKVKHLLEWWRGRTTNIVTVNNLYPHCYERHPVFCDLYSSFYQACDLITHYTEASKHLVCDEFPETRKKMHLVHHPFTYPRWLRVQTARGERRAEVGLGKDDFVILVLGSLRSWSEIELIKAAYDIARVPRKRLLMAGRYNEARLEPSSLWRQRWRRLNWTSWLKRRRAVVHTEYIPEEELSRFLDSSDIVIVPRLVDLNSALPSLAMTFGRAVIAPKHGAYPEILSNTQNLLYESGKPESLAAALEQASSMNLDEIGQHNAQVAATWTWKELVQSCISTVSQLPPPGQVSKS